MSKLSQPDRVTVRTKVDEVGQSLERKQRREEQSLQRRAISLQWVYLGSQVRVRKTDRSGFRAAVVTEKKGRQGCTTLLLLRL